MMGILDRVRAAMLHRDLAALRAADRAEREGATTEDLMRNVNARAAQIVHLEAKIRALDGVEDEPESEFGDTRIPSSMFIPTKPPKE